MDLMCGFLENTKISLMNIKMFHQILMGTGYNYINYIYNPNGR